MAKESTKASEELNERQRKFAEFYLDSGHITNSAKQAGYSEVSAYSTGSDLLRNPKISRYIEALKEERKNRIHAQLAKYAEEAVQQMAKLAAEAESENVRAMALKDLMDRAGYKPTDKIDQNSKIDAKIEFGFVDPATKQ